MIDKPQDLKLGDVLADKRGRAFPITAIKNTPQGKPGERWYFQLALENGEHTFITDAHFDRMSVVAQIAPKEVIQVDAPTPKVKKAKK